MEWIVIDIKVAELDWFFFFRIHFRAHWGTEPYVALQAGLFYLGLVVRCWFLAALRCTLSFQLIYSIVGELGGVGQLD